MNYANHIKNRYFKHKENRDKIRASDHLKQLSLEFYLDKCYQQYRNFCYDLGIRPKTKANFLHTEVI